MSTLKYPVIMLLGGYLFLGLSHIAILPPWEGFDETAHFSYIQQIADTGSLPTPGSARISTDVDDYMRYGPMPYCYVPLFKESLGYTYYIFFSLPPSIVKKGYTYTHEPPATPRKYKPAMMINWQTQHPPLYYALIAPLYKITRGLALIDQLFWLRLVSYLFGWSALVITVIGGYRLASLCADSGKRVSKHWLVFGTTCIPLLFPSWFPEMARIGNDSLCALLLSLVWLLLIRIQTVGKTFRIASVLGFLLGIGCLTKAFYMPLSAGLIFYLLLHDVLFAGGSKKVAVSATLMTILVLLVVSGWWYWGNWLEGRSLLGSNEMNSLSVSGGLIDSIRHHFSLNAWLRGHAALITTLGWSCTWSFIRPPYLFMLPLAGLVVFIAVSYLCALPRHKIHTLAWAPFWCALPIIAGLSYHVLLMIALTGKGHGTSGYYLLFMVPVIGSAIGLGLGSFCHKRLFRVTTVLLWLYAVFFAVVISWAQLMLFAGIFSASDDNKFYRLPEAFHGLLSLPEAMANLSKLAYPKLGVICWLVGGGFVIVGIALGWRTTRTLATAD